MKRCGSCGHILSLDDDPDRNAITPEEAEEIVAAARVRKSPFPYQIVIRQLAEELDRMRQGRGHE